MRIRFEDFILDADRRALARNGRPIRVTDTAFNLLVKLIERRPNIVLSSELAPLLWPDRRDGWFRLHPLAAELREALHDHDGRVVRHVEGLGYAFAAKALVLDDLARSPFRLWIGQETYPLPRGETLIGRCVAAGVRSNSQCVSCRHAIITIDNSRATICDLGSRNGTFVGGRRVRSLIALANGDHIVFGCVAASFVTSAKA